MNEDLCLDCYQENIFLPSSSNLLDALSIGEMITYLKMRNQSIAQEADAHEVQEMYELCKIDEDRHTNIDKLVPYPTYSTNSLTIQHSTSNNDTKRYEFGNIFHAFEL